MPDRALDHKTALRSFQGYVSTPLFWGTLAVVSCICTFAEPFGTQDMPFGIRLIYWSLIAVLTGTLGLAFGALAVGYQLHNRLAQAGFAIGFGLSASALTLGLSLALLPALEDQVPLRAIAAYSFFSATPIYALVQSFLMSGQKPGAEDRPPERARPKILDRDPNLSAASTVWALSAQDHYVLIHSDAGQALILMRLADAIAECEQDVPGVQIHRSHWVAKAVLGQIEKQGGKAMVRLPGGELLPISRRKAAELSA